MAIDPQEPPAFPPKAPKAWVEASLAELSEAERETLAAAAELMERMVAR